MVSQEGPLVAAQRTRTGLVTAFERPFMAPRAVDLRRAFRYTVSMIQRVLNVPGEDLALDRLSHSQASTYGRTGHRTGSAGRTGYAARALGQ